MSDRLHEIKARQREPDPIPRTGGFVPYIRVGSFALELSVGRAK